MKILTFFSKYIIILCSQKLTFNSKQIISSTQKSKRAKRGHKVARSTLTRHAYFLLIFLSISQKCVFVDMSLDHNVI